MTNRTLEVFVAAYSDEAGAGVACKDLKEMELSGAINLVDAAVVVRRADGKVHFEETADPSGKTWAKRGAVAGGLVGLLFPPAIIASAAVTAGAGGIWGKIRDKGFDDDELKAVGESLEPGSSALIAIAEDKVVENLTKGLEGYDRLSRHILSADAAAVLMAEAAPATT
jgi:uncharacterized membrane protein